MVCNATFAGAGAGIARRFAREGYKVALISRRQESIAPVEKELRASGAETLAVPCDTGRHACACMCNSHPGSIPSDFMP